jgi:hypothetical protein
MAFSPHALGFQVGIYPFQWRLSFWFGTLWTDIWVGPIRLLFEYGK